MKPDAKQPPLRTEDKTTAEIIEAIRNAPDSAAAWELLPDVKRQRSSSKLPP